MAKQSSLPSQDNNSLKLREQEEPQLFGISLQMVFIKRMTPAARLNWNTCLIVRQTTKLRACTRCRVLGVFAKYFRRVLCAYAFADGRLLESISYL